MRSAITSALIGFVVGLAVLALPCAVDARDKIIMVPKNCVVVDQFYKPCPQSLHGGYDCQIHISIKSDPDCQQYDHQRFLQVPK